MFRIRLSSVVAEEVFYSLNVVDLPEYYEDHMQEWFQGFQMMLKYSNPALDTGQLDAIAAAATASPIVKH